MWPKSLINLRASFAKEFFLPFATCLGIILFFQNPFLVNFFNPGSEDWYVNFSVMIFHPNEAYWNESILLPLIGKLTGASKSLVSYKLLCAFISILLLPILAFLSQRHFSKISNAYLFLLVFSVGFRYLWSYDLGHPDPLTIVLLCCIPFLRSRLAIFACAFFATLSHFSLSLVAILEIVILYCLSYLSNKKQSWNTVLASILGLGIGRLFLAAWYWVFHYTSPFGRIEFILNSGFSFFYDRYQANPVAFWLTPGIPYIIVNAIMLILFSANKKWWPTFGLILTNLLSYCVLFVTVDGLRIFSVICCCSFIYLLIQSIDTFQSKSGCKATK